MVLMPLDFLLRWLIGPLAIALLQAIPNAKLVVLHPAGHMGLMERNAQFAEAVRSFSISPPHSRSSSSF